MLRLSEVLKYLDKNNRKVVNMLDSVVIGCWGTRYEKVRAFFLK